MLPLAIPLAFAAACSTHPVDRRKGQNPPPRPPLRSAIRSARRAQTNALDEHSTAPGFGPTHPTATTPCCPPCAYSTSVMPNHSRLDGSPRPAVGTAPPSISLSIGCARDYLGRPTSFFRQILSLLRLTTSLHLPPCLMSTPAIGHQDFHWYSASQPSPASWFSGARRRPSSVCALPLEQVPQHLLGAVELMSPSSKHLAHRSSPAPSSFCCQTVPPVS
jgi:hypothetical protein